MDLGDAWEWSDDPQVSGEVGVTGVSDRYELFRLRSDALIPEPNHLGLTRCGNRVTHELIAREIENRVAASDRHMLLATAQIADRVRLNGRAGLKLPE